MGTYNCKSGADVFFGKLYIFLGRDVSDFLAGCRYFDVQTQVAKCDCKFSEKFSAGACLAGPLGILSKSSKFVNQSIPSGQLRPCMS